MAYRTVNGKAIEHYKDLDVRETGLAESAVLQHAIVNGYAPNDFIIEGISFYLPLYALKGSKFKSVDAGHTTCTASNTTWGEKGSTFNGTNSIIDCGNQSVAKTCMFTINLTSTTESILEEVDDTGISVAGGTMSYGSWDNCYVNTTDTDTIATGWKLVTLTSSTNVDVSAFRLGLVNATYLDAVIGEVWLYTDEFALAGITHNYNVTIGRYS